MTSEWNVVLDVPEIKPKVISRLGIHGRKLAQYTPPGLFEVSLKEMLNNFTSGTCAMTSYTGRLIHQDRRPVPQNWPINIALMAYPFPEGGRSAVTFANDGFSIAKTDNSEEAVKFFRWFLKNDKLTDYQLTVPLHYQPPQFSTSKNPRWRSHPLVEKHWAAMEVMLSFMNTDKTHVGSIQLEGPGPSPNQGRIWTSDVLPRHVPEFLVQEDVCERCRRRSTQGNPRVHREGLSLTLVTLRRPARGFLARRRAPGPHWAVGKARAQALSVRFWPRVWC